MTYIKICKIDNMWRCLGTYDKIYISLWDNFEDALADALALLKYYKLNAKK